MTGPPGNQSRFEWNAGSVRALRRFLGMSQSIFAAELGVRQQTVSEWETGMYRPRGASATLLTMIAANSGFIHDVPGYPSGIAPSVVHAPFR
jgi:DNA-binding transcriptional regulator YiaG